MNNVEEIQLVIQPALDAYAERNARHGRDYSTMITRCVCGFVPPYETRTRKANQSLGMHLHHELKRSDRLYKIESDSLLKEYYR